MKITITLCDTVGDKVYSADKVQSLDLLKTRHFPLGEILASIVDDLELAVRSAEAAEEPQPETPE